MLPAGQAYRVWKKGSSLRVDSSSSQTEWDTGITLIFKEEGRIRLVLGCLHANLYLFWKEAIYLCLSVIMR